MMNIGQSDILSHKKESNYLIYITYWTVGRYLRLDVHTIDNIKINNKHISAVNKWKGLNKNLYLHNAYAYFNFLSGFARTSLKKLEMDAGLV